MKMIKKAKEYFKSIQTLKKSGARRSFRSVSGAGIGFSRMDNVSSGNVLVLTPHPDDEVIGCCGAIIKHLKQKDSVKIVYLTDGSAGFPEKFKPSQKEKRELANRRELEAKKSSEFLGLKDLVFMRQKDGELKASKNNLKFFSQLIIEYEPDIIYTPSVEDPNSDHAVTSKILYLTLPKLKNKVEINQYEIWSPIMPNRLLNIDREMKKKCSALSFSKSQLKSRNYINAIQGLNSYRGAITGTSKYAEAFFSSGKKFFEEYYRFWQ